MKLLDGGSVAATISPALQSELQSKFPDPKENYTEQSLLTPLHPEVSDLQKIRFSNDDLLFLAKKTNSFSAPGPSGLTMEALLYPLKKLEQSPVDEAYIDDLRFYLEQVVNGDPTCTDYLRDSRLIPLQKPDGGIRPICVGEVIRRFAGRLLLSKVHSKILQVLGPTQTCMIQRG
jgi:hypothetical protein